MARVDLVLSSGFGLEYTYKPLPEPKLPLHVTQHLQTGVPCSDPTTKQTQAEHVRRLPAAHSRTMLLAEVSPGLVFKLEVVFPSEL